MMRTIRAADFEILIFRNVIIKRAFLSESALFASHNY